MDMENTGSNSFPTVVGDAFENFDFNWSDDGELTLSEHGIPAPAEAAPAVPVEPAVEVTPKVAEKSPEVIALEAKVAELTAMAEAVEKPPAAPAEAPIAHRTVADVIAGRDMMDVYSDPAEAAKYQEEVFAAQMAPLIDAMRPMMIQWRVTQEVKEMFQKYGKDFEDRLPIIKTLSQKRPDLTMQEAYDFAKAIPIPAPSVAKTGQVEATGKTTTAAPPVTVSAEAEAQAIAEKAIKLRTEQGVAGTGEMKEQIKTIKQALNMAVEEVLNKS